MTRLPSATFEGRAEVEARYHGCPDTFHFPTHIGAFGYPPTLAAMDWAHQRDAAGRNSCPGDPFGSLCIHNNGIFAALPFLWRWEYTRDVALLREHWPLPELLRAATTRLCATSTTAHQSGLP